MVRFKSYTEEDFTRMSAERLRRIAYIKPDFDVFEPGPGDHAIRIIPPLAEETWTDAFYLSIRTHWLGKTVLCPRSIQSLQRNCPVCEEFFERRKQGDIPKEIQGISGIIRHLLWVWVVPLQGQDPELKPRIYPCPDSLLDSILRASRDRLTKRFINFLDPQQGGLVLFTREGQGISTKYTNVEIDKQPVPIPQEVLEKVVLWQEALIVPSEEELSQLLEDYLAREGNVEPQEQDIPVTPPQTAAPPPEQPEPQEPPPVPEDANERLAAIRQRIAQLRQS